VSRWRGGQRAAGAWGGAPLSAPQSPPFTSTSISSSLYAAAVQVEAHLTSAVVKVLQAMHGGMAMLQGGVGECWVMVERTTRPRVQVPARFRTVAQKASELSSEATHPVGPPTHAVYGPLQA
jgi:hypothetical protein